MCWYIFYEKIYIFNILCTFYTLWYGGIEKNANWFPNLHFLDIYHFDRVKLYSLISSYSILIGYNILVYFMEKIVELIKFWWYFIFFKDNTWLDRTYNRSIFFFHGLIFLCFFTIILSMIKNFSNGFLGFFKKISTVTKL